MLHFNGSLVNKSAAVSETYFNFKAGEISGYPKKNALNTAPTYSHVFEH